MPKTKLDGAEKPIINNFYKTKHFEYDLKRADRPKPTAAFHINRSRQICSLATSVIGDSYGPPAETHTKGKK